MNLGKNLFKKDQSIWGKPIISYDETKMETLFSEIHQAENSEEILPATTSCGAAISLETEFYLMLHS